MGLGPIRSCLWFPPESELRLQAETSTVVAQLRGLAQWAGHEGRVVTAAGRLRMADVRELVDVLGTGDRTEGVRSSNDLPRLGLLVEWAKKARLVRVAKPAVRGGKGPAGTRRPASVVAARLRHVFRAAAGPDRCAQRLAR
ncbi:hypothetical protein ABZT04_22245 [Streptomyces sp. NPDC005492]|uniref:hypothetical protein n=1 Tax=Streptomyces sp. NPDC005492 TaxID=3156883 RepID=UPI0033BD8681